MNTVSPSGGVAGQHPGTAIRWVVAGGSASRPAPGQLPGRRLRHGTELAWWPVDAVLAARDLSNLVVMAATAAVAVVCACDGGLTSVIMDLPGLAVVWGAAYGLIRLGRWWRGVHPPEHEPPSRQR